MQNLINTELSMTSKEIAELVGSREDSVKRTIERLAEKNIISEPPTVDGIKAANGTIPQHYVFSGEKGKRDSIIVVAQLSPEFTARLVDRWQQLEQEKSLGFNPNDQIAVLENLLLEKKRNKELEHKVESMENLFKEGMTTTQFCKMLNGVNVNQINHHLHKKNWLYNESKSGNNLRWRTSSYARDKYLTEKQNQFIPHGEESFITYQPVLLKKGAQRIYEMYLNNELPMKKTWNGLHTHDKSIRIAA
ncbi:phage antirepressor KilAC domain-containing protein [Providencia rettgeri]